MNLLLAIVPITFFSFAYYQANAKQDLLKQQVNKELNVEVLPDELYINENRYRAIVYLPELKQNVILFGTMKNESDEKLIRSIKTKVQLELTGDLDLLNPAPNVNQFDSKSFYAQKGIYGQIRVTQLHKIQPSKTKILDIIHLIRFSGLDMANRFPKHLKLYVQSLIFGYKNFDFKDEMDGAQQLGIIHLFSISGMHVYFLIDVILIGSSLLYIKRENVEWFLILMLPIYSIIAGSAVGLIRAILMAEERLTIRKVNLHLTRLDIWSLALMINLLINPTMLLEFGCQLSYMLSLALIYIGNVSELKRTLLLELISFPIVIFYMYEWHVLSLMANLLIIPFFTGFIFPLVLLGFGLGFFEFPFLEVIDRILAYFDQFTNLIAQFPGKITFGKPWIGYVLFMILIGLLYIEKKKVKYIVLLMMASIGMFLFIHFPLTGEVTYFDVGQGDSILVREPFNKSITLIDTGGKPNFFSQSGVRTVYQAPNTSIRYLKSIGINKINNICLSHQDADHIGDLPAFLKEMKVENIYIPAGMEKNQHFMKKLRGFNNFKLISVKNGDIIKNSQLQVLHPFTSGLGKNEDSMVLFGKINHLNWMFTGDLDKNNELKIINEYPNLRIDILKLGHHGSKTSSDFNFIKAIQLRVGIISAGRNNHYGHPNEETIVTMKQNKVKLISTQKDGMISYRYTNNQGYFMTKWRGKLDVFSR